MLGKLSKITWLVENRARFETQADWLQGSHSCPLLYFFFFLIFEPLNHIFALLDNY